MVHPKDHETLSIREDILATLRKMEPFAEKLGSAAALEELYRATHTGNDATYLRQEYATSGSTEGMVDAAIRRFRGDVAETPGSGIA